MEKAEFEKRVAEVCGEFDPAKDEALARFRDYYSDEEWTTMIDQARAAVEREARETIFERMVGEFAGDGAVRLGLATSAKGVVAEVYSSCLTDHLDVLWDPVTVPYVQGRRNLWNKMPDGVVCAYEETLNNIRYAARAKIRGTLDAELESILSGS